MSESRDVDLDYLNMALMDLDLFYNRIPEDVRIRLAARNLVLPVDFQMMLAADCTFGVRATFALRKDIDKAALAVLCLEDDLDVLSLVASRHDLTKEQCIFLAFKNQHEITYALKDNSVVSSFVCDLFPAWFIAEHFQVFLNAALVSFSGDSDTFWAFLPGFEGSFKDLLQLCLLVKA